MPATIAEPFETKTLGEEPDATAPDGTAVRLLLSLPGGSMAHFELPAGAVSHAVAHRTVEEIWFVVSGRGSIWRRQDGVERIDALGPGASLTIPLGTAFQFRAEAGAPLASWRSPCPPGPAWTRRCPSPAPGRRPSRPAPSEARPCARSLADSPLTPQRRFSSVVEQRFCKPWVGGSIPSTGTNTISSLALLHASQRLGQMACGMR